MVVPTKHIQDNAVLSKSYKLLILLETVVIYLLTINVHTNSKVCNIALKYFSNVQ